ncbi:hypothetical protein BH11ACT8_BH11ACT8_35690 [soil metagenome]
MTTLRLAGHDVRPPVVLAALLVLGAAAALVVGGHAPWWVLPLGVLGPDLAFLAAVGSPAPEERGAMPPRAVAPYNAVHHPAVAAVCTLLAGLLAGPTLVALGLAWCSHIVWDRAVGYGLRTPEGHIRPVTAAR